MKITYISASILPSTKANSVNVMKMCQGLAENGHQVTLVATSGSSISEKLLFEQYNITHQFSLVLTSNGKFSSLKRLLKGISNSRNADLVYTRWILAACIVALLGRKKVIFEHHSPFNKGFYSLLERYLIKSNNIVRHIFITQALKDYYSDKYSNIHHENFVVLPDGADAINLKPDNYDYDCVYVGSFQKGKGVEIIIEVANALPSVTFAIVGGSEEEIFHFKKRVYNNNVHWLGHLPHNETSKFIQKSKIALLPNQKSVIAGANDIGKWTSPMKLFEYMSNGKAIIASNLNVLKEILVNEENAILVEPDNVMEWNKAIQALLKDEKLRKRIAAKALWDLSENYTWTKRAERSVSNLSKRNIK